MDYKKIIINGILDENTKSHLDLYFYRQYENAKEKKYSLIEFFSGLIKGIEELTTLAINEREKEKKNLLNDIEFAKTRPYNTKEDVEREIQWQKTKAENLLNSSPSIEIENENYKAKITLKILESVLFFIKTAFHKAKANEGEPMPNENEILISKIVINTNKDLFHYANEEQWKNFVNGNFKDLKITIKSNAKLNKTVAVIDEIMKRFNIDALLKDFENYNVFEYKGKTLTAKQYSDARNEVRLNKIQHYFE